MNNQTKVIANGKIVDISKNPVAFALESAAEIFRHEQTLIRSKEQGSVVELSENILHVMGVTMVTENTDEDVDYTADFSLVGAKNNDTGIDNPNIIDPDINTLTPELTDAKDKFLSTEDPFYEQDETKTDTYNNTLRMRSRSAKRPLVSIAKDMCTPHLSHQVNNQSRYFVNKNTSSRRRKR